jgi:hypothetical protein
MSCDKLVQWTSPVAAAFLAAAGTSTTNGNTMDVVEFRRSRESDFNCMTLSKEGTLLAAGTVDCMITVWDVIRDGLDAAMSLITV